MNHMLPRNIKHAHIWSQKGNNCVDERVFPEKSSKHVIIIRDPLLDTHYGLECITKLDRIRAPHHVLLPLHNSKYLSACYRYDNMVTTW
jgi:hypothetical protein